MDVALVTCARLPEPDPDEQPLLAALRASGLSAESLAWDDASAPFEAACLLLLRATWNYSLQPERFANWIDEMSSRKPLWNPPRVVRWNLHKRYLLELAARGVSVVPTELVPGGSRATLAELCARRAWDDVVVKPAIAAGSRATARFGRGAFGGAGEAHFAALRQQEDVLVQPYLPGVEDYGERSLVWIAGEVTHAVRKERRFAGDAESVSQAALPITDAERALAQRALAAAPGPLLYARIDMAPGPDGPVLMELELIEPSLFFAQAPHALDRMVQAVHEKLGAARPT